MSRLRRLLVTALLVLPLLAACQETALEPGPGGAPRPSADADGTTGEGREPTPESGPPRRATTAREVAAQIRTAHAAIADRDTSPEALDAAGHQQQLAYRVLGVRPAWDARVRELLPRRLHEQVRRNVAARRELRAMHTTLSDTLPAWRIVEPPPPAELRAHYRRAERRFGVDWEYLAAINLVETAMGRIRGTSTAGARGPMQFIPSTWELYGEGDITSYRDSILAAGRYLSARGFTEPGGVPGALYSYNNSPRYVRAVTHLAEVMKDDPRAHLGYHHWEVYFLTDRGDVLLPVGYAAQRPVPVERYLRRHPQR